MKKYGKYIVIVAIIAAIIVGVVFAITGGFDKNKKANESIRQALKDKEWIMSNLMPALNMNKEIPVTEDDYNRSDLYFEKIDMGGAPVYIISDKRYSGEVAVLVSYKEGKVKVSKLLFDATCLDDKGISVDLKKGIMKGQSEGMDAVECVYKVNNGEFEKVLDYTEEYNGYGGEYNTKRHYFYNGKEIELDDYNKKIEEIDKDCNYSKITKKLTNENIDKYVK